MHFWMFQEYMAQCEADGIEPSWEGVRDFKNSEMARAFIADCRRHGWPETKSCWLHYKAQYQMRLVWKGLAHPDSLHLGEAA